MRTQTTYEGRGWLRWFGGAAGVLLAAALALWAGAAPLVAAMLVRELRQAGYDDAQVLGAAVVFDGVTIRRVELAPGDAFVLEGVRARLGLRGLESFAVVRLHVRAEVNSAGQVSLPGPAAEVGGRLPLEIVPPEGLTLATAEIELATPVGAATLSLSEASVLRRAEGAQAAARYSLEHDAGRIEGDAIIELEGDGTVRGRLGVAGGRIVVSRVEAGGLSGEITAIAPAAGTRGIELALSTSDVLLAGRSVGSLAATAAWRDGTAAFTVRSGDTAGLDVALEGRAEVRAGLRSLDVSGLATVDQPRVRGRMALDLRLNGGGGDRELAGRVRLEGRDVSVPELFDHADIDLAADADVDGARLRLTSATPWLAELTPAGGLLPEAMRNLEGERVTFAITPPPSGEPLRLLIETNLRAARLEAALAARAGEAAIQASGSFAASGLGGLTVTAEQVRLDVAALPWEDLAFGVEGFEGAASYAADEWQVRGGGTVSAGGTLAGATADRLTARWSGTIAGTRETAVVAAEDCVRWEIAGLQWRDVRVAQVAPPCIKPGELATYVADGSGVRLAAATAEQPLELELHRGGETTAVRGTWPALELSANVSRATATSLRAGLTGAALVLPDVSVAGVSGSVDVRDGALSSASVTATVIQSSAQPPVWAPLQLEATAQAAGADIQFETLLSDALGFVVVEAAGRYAGGSATADVTLHPLYFASGATEVGDVSPLLAEHVADASGTIGFQGQLDWSAAGLRSRGTLTVRDFAATVAGVPIAGVDTATSFSSVLPPVTLPEQTVHIGALDLGVPLAEGTVVYDIGAEGRLAVRRLEFGLAGGRLSAEPFTVSSGALRDTRLVLQAEEVDLSQLLVLSGIDGLQGTGVLSGRVPVRFSNRGVELDDGVLAAETDGVLRYTPENLPTFLRGDDVRARMLREALTNFQYDELSVTIAGQSGDGGGEQSVRLSAKGANPEFLEGHPIELNFNFQGPLLGALRSAVDLSGGEDVQQMFEQQDRRESESRP